MNFITFFKYLKKLNVKIHKTKIKILLNHSKQKGFQYSNRFFCLNFMKIVETTK